MDENEFARRVSLMERRLYLTCRTLLKSDADCADAVQETLIKAWRALGRLKHEEYFETWLTRIAINECKALARSARPTCALDERCVAPGPPDNALAEALDALDVRLRLPLTLHYIDGYDISEVARILRLPVGTVKSRLHRARKRLRALLNEEDCI